MTTDRQAEEAARQLTYHRRHVNWIERRMQENEEKLVTYLVERGAYGVFIGGHEVWIDGEQLCVRELPTELYEQLEFQEVR